MDWFRSWHGAPTDNKWLLIAKRAGVTPMMVSATFWALLDYASQQEERGSVDGFDVETYAMWADCDETDVLNILNAMRAKGVITDANTLAAWDKRQPKREDDSAERVRRHRESKRNSVTDEPVTQCNATVTQCNAPDKIRLDTEQSTEDNGSADAVPAEPPKPLAEEFSSVQAELKTSNNKAAVLHRWYVRCFGADAAPDYGYLGRVAKQVGGAGHLAQLMLQLAPRPPAGDVLAYIQKMHSSKDSGYTNGNGNAYNGTAGSGYSMSAFNGSEK